ncbi:MAG: LysE family translocator [Thermomonas sp.]
MIIPIETLWLFIAAATALLLSPGPNMALVVAQALAQGVRGGIAVASGILLADLVMTLLVMAGIAATLAAWPGALGVIQAAGALYLAWLGVQSLRGHPQRGQVEVIRSTPAIVRLSLLTSLLNPKALLFFLVFLPQFVAPERGPVALQLGLLGALLALLAFAFHAALGVASAHAGRRVTFGQARVIWLGRLQALVFFALAARLLLA